MTVNITIIGLGQIGASLGLALANHKDQVTTTGHDKSAAVARDAQKRGAVDKINYNLPASVEGANVVILALPLDQIYETLKYITLDVRAETVIMDTAPAKMVVSGWVRELMASDRHYVGLSPALNPRVLEEAGRGLAAARADLFTKGLMGISAPSGTPGEALKLAAGLAVLVGAEPFFADMAELDGIMASAHLLPALAAASLAETVLSQPGWGDIRKLAGKSFMGSMNLAEMEEPEALAEIAVRNKVDSLRVLDNYIANLQLLREDIDKGEMKDLRSRISEIVKSLELWRLERHQANWRADEFTRQELPKMGDIMRQQLGGLDKLFKRGKKKSDSE